MSQLGVVALVTVTVWLGVLTLSLVLVVRQLSLLTLRIASIQSSPQVVEDGFSVHDDGPEVGSAVSDEAASLWPELRGERSLLLLVSATCRGCRQLAEDLNKNPEVVEKLPTTALVPGPTELADAIASLMPSDVRLLRDPVATSLANAVGVQSTPFAIVFHEGRVQGKAYVDDKADLVVLIGETEGEFSESEQALDPMHRG